MSDSRIKINIKSSLSTSFAAAVDLLKTDWSAQVENCDYTTQSLSGNLLQGVAESEHACSADSPWINAPQ